jgi:uncharacterized protein (TIGR02996 family)
MTDRDALYRAIIEEPADDTLRLVYADALEEAGDAARAAFVREQVELARLPDYDPRAIQLRSREAAAWPDEEWMPPELPDGISWARDPFRRGLLGAIEAIDGSVLVAHADELFTRFPIESLDVRVVRMSEVRELAECPWLARIASLAFTQGTSAPVVGPILDSPHLMRLTELRLGSEFTTPATVSAVVRSPAFKQLTSLTVRSDSRSGGTMAAELARVASPPALRELALPGNRLAADTLGPLVASRAVAAVEELDLSDNHLGDWYTTVLAGGHFPALRSLRLERAGLLPRGVQALVSAAFYPWLQSLSLAGSFGGPYGGPEVAFALASVPPKSLRVLDLGENGRIGDTGAQALARSEGLRSLLVLDLSEGRVGSPGAEALADSPHLGGLAHLNLAGNPIGERAADRLRARFGNRVSL